VIGVYSPLLDRQLRIKRQPLLRQLLQGGLQETRPGVVHPLEPPACEHRSVVGVGALPGQLLVLWQWVAREQRAMVTPEVTSRRDGREPSRSRAWVLPKAL